MTGRGRVGDKTKMKWTEKATKQRQQSDAAESFDGIVLPVFGGVTMEGLQEKMEAEAKRQRGISIRECAAIEFYKAAISGGYDCSNYDETAVASVKAADALVKALGYSLPQEEVKEEK